MNVVEKIEKLIRSRQGYTAVALERDAGLSEDRISKVKESAGKNLRAWEALRIARVFEVPVEYLIDDEMDEVPQPPPALTLSEAEERALEMVRELDLTKGEVIRRLSTQLPPRRPASERIIVEPPEPPAEPSPRRGRKNRPAG